MSRGIIYTATFKDFLEGFMSVDVPAGYNRIQFNQFTAGATRNYTVNNRTLAWGWLELDKTLDTTTASEASADKIFVTQKCPINLRYSKIPNGSLILKVWCEGIDAQSNVVAAAPVGETLYLGMNGNPYKITNRSLKIYITNESDYIVNNLGIVLQYTFI